MRAVDSGDSERERQPRTMRERGVPPLGTHRLCLPLCHGALTRCTECSSDLHRCMSLPAAERMRISRPLHVHDHLCLLCVFRSVKSERQAIIAERRAAARRNTRKKRLTAWTLAPRCDSAAVSSMYCHLQLRTVQKGDPHCTCQMLQTSLSHPMQHLCT